MEENTSIMSIGSNSIKLSKKEFYPNKEGMYMKTKYDLTLMEALERCLNGEGFMRGDGFKSGVYVKLHNGMLVTVDANKMNSYIDTFIVSTTLQSQRFKIFPVANAKALEM